MGYVRRSSGGHLASARGTTPLPVRPVHHTVTLPPLPHDTASKTRTGCGPPRGGPRPIALLAIGGPPAAGPEGGPGWAPPGGGPGAVPSLARGGPRGRGGGGPGPPPRHCRSRPDAGRPWYADGEPKLSSAEAGLAVRFDTTAGRKT